MKGIDVYTGDGIIDWKKVSTSDVGFAMIKATQGYLVANPKSGMFTDSKFEYNITNATDNGIKCGVYHYIMAKTVENAKAEAKYFVSKILPFKDRITLFAAVDMENDKAKKYARDEKKLNTNILLAFCEIVEKAGFKSAIYINPNFIKYYLEFDRLAGKNIWLARWCDDRTVRSYIESFKDPSQFKIWQYGKASVPGIKKETDGDIALQIFVENDSFKPGDRVKIIGDRYYNGVLIPDSIKKIHWIVSSVNGDRVVINKSADGKRSINSAVDVKDLRKC